MLSSSLSDYMQLMTSKNNKKRENFREYKRSNTKVFLDKVVSVFYIEERKGPVEKQYFRGHGIVVDMHVWLSNYLLKYTKFDCPCFLFCSTTSAVTVKSAIRRLKELKDQ